MRTQAKGDPPLGLGDLQKEVTLLKPWALHVPLGEPFLPQVSSNERQNGPTD